MSLRHTFQLITVPQTLISVQDIQSLSMSRKFLVSFDVESLFTNLSLEECIDVIDQKRVRVFHLGF